MALGIQFTSYIPTSLVGNNSPSPTLAAEVVTGFPIPTGAFPGNVFSLTEAQANQLSQFPVNAAPQLVCHAGVYMVVQVSASAVAGNIKAGSIGAQAVIPVTSAQSNSTVPYQSIVTDGATAATAGLLGTNPVVFLNAVTPGNYTIVQIGGDASVLLAASQTTVVGQALLSQTPGTVLSSAAALTGANIQNLIGQAELVTTSPAAALVLSSVAASIGGSAVYTGTITNGGSNAFANQTFIITGFTGAATVDNGTYLCTASTGTTLTLSNPNAVAVTAAGTATSNNLVRANISFPFGTI